MNSTSPWSPMGTMWLCGHSPDCVQGWHHKTAHREKNVAPSAARKAGVCDPGSDDQELICIDLHQRVGDPDG